MVLKVNNSKLGTMLIVHDLKEHVVTATRHLASSLCVTLCALSCTNTGVPSPSPGWCTASLPAVPPNLIGALSPASSPQLRLLFAVHPIASDQSRDSPVLRRPPISPRRN